MFLRDLGDFSVELKIYFFGILNCSFYGQHKDFFSNLENLKI